MVCASHCDTATASTLVFASSGASHIPTSRSIPRHEKQVAPFLAKAEENDRAKGTRVLEMRTKRERAGRWGWCNFEAFRTPLIHG